MMRRYEVIADELGMDTGYIVGANRMSRCPIHQGRDRNFSFNLDTGVWHCFASRGCGNANGGGTLVSLVAEVEGINLVQALAFIARIEQGVEPRDDIDDETFQQEVVGTFDYVADAPEQRRLRSDIDRARWPRWWPERGFDADDWMRWDCGLDLVTSEANLPCYDLDGGLAGEIRRRYPGSEPKYLYSRGFKKSEHLFGEHLLPRRIGLAATQVRPVPVLVLVEGPLDAIWGWKHGFPTVAILGSRLSDAQVRLIRDRVRPGAIVLAFDADDAGRRCTAESIARYGREFPDLRVAEMPPGAKDIQDVREHAAVVTTIAGAITVDEYAFTRGLAQ